MSPTQARIRDHLVNAAITSIATLFLTFGTGLWRSKESVADHNADINAIADVLCEIKPDARACKRLGHSGGEVAQR
jgi:hypothetical protein